MVRQDLKNSACSDSGIVRMRVRMMTGVDFCRRFTQTASWVFSIRRKAPLRQVRVVPRGPSHPVMANA